MKLVLASASTSRARMLQAAGVPFDIVPAHVDEDAIKQSMLSPRDIADTLAELKALRVSSRYPGALVLGADQVLAFGSELVSKSADMDEAAELLGRLRGQRHELLSAAVLAKDGVPVWRHVSVSKLWMRTFTDEFLYAYLEAEGEDVLSGVGCYRLEGLGSQLFERIEGDYFSILDLPLLPLLAGLRELGILVT